MLAATPLVELMMQRADPRASVEVYLQVGVCKGTMWRLIAVGG